MKLIRAEVQVDYKPQHQKTLDSGIIIPIEEGDTNILTLKVLDVGLKCTEVQQGDTILIRKVDLREFDVDNKIVFFVDEKFVLAKV